jgi:nucleoside-diphosphate-sugar epimerase
VRTAVIGGGLVGSQVLRQLVEEGERPVLFDVAPQLHALGEIVDLELVTVVRGDILDPLALVEAIRAHGVGRLVHTAVNPVLGVGAQERPYPAIQVNVMGTVNVLEAARVLGLGRVVLSSTSSLTYHLAGGEDGGDPRREEAFPRPVTIYAASKQACESFGLAYARWFGVDVVLLRFAAVFGPWSGRGGGGPSQALGAMVEAALRGTQAMLPATALEWVYSKDAAAAACLALRAERLQSRVFQVGMGCLYTADAVAETMRAIVPGARVEVMAQPSAHPVLQDMRAPMDGTRARRELGYEPRFDLAAGLRDHVAWASRTASARRDA